MLLKVRLKELLAERGMTQKDLARTTGLNEGTLSDIANNARTTINRQHISTIAEALGIEDPNEILYFEK